jgi:hypothetical protein
MATDPTRQYQSAFKSPDWRLGKASSQNEHYGRIVTQGRGQVNVTGAAVGVQLLHARFSLGLGSGLALAPRVKARGFEMTALT